MSPFLRLLDLFALGDAWPILPHALMNLLFDDAIRIVSRYEVVTLLGLLILAHRVIQRLASDAPLPTWVHRLCLSVVVLNLLTFPVLDLSRAMEWGGTWPARAHGSTLVAHAVLPGSIDLRDGGDLSAMYTPVRSGRGVLRCYSPLNRDYVAHATPPTYREGPFGRELSLVYQAPDVSAACVAESRAVGSTLEIASACPPRVCLNVNARTLYDDAEGWTRDATLGRDCRQPTPP